MEVRIKRYNDEAIFSTELKYLGIIRRGVADFTDMNSLYTDFTQQADSGTRGRP